MGDIEEEDGYLEVETYSGGQTKVVRRAVEPRETPLSG